MPQFYETKRWLWVEYLGKFSWRTWCWMVGRELERERKVFMEREILRKAELQKKSYCSYLSFYPLSSSLQSAQLSELWAGWGGVISEWRRLFHFPFSHSSRLSQIWNACLTFWVTTCFQVWPKLTLKTYWHFKQELKLDLFYILILKFIGMIFLSGMLCPWKIPVYSLNYSKSHEEKLKCLTSKENWERSSSFIYKYWFEWFICMSRFILFLATTSWCSTTQSSQFCRQKTMAEVNRLNAPQLESAGAGNQTGSLTPRLLPRNSLRSYVTDLVPCL